MKAKTATVAILVLLLLIGAGVFGYVRFRGGDETPDAVAIGGRGSAAVPRTGIVPLPNEPAITVIDPLPGQGRVVVEPIAEGGSIAGRIINWSTGEGVAGAELTFTSAGGAVTIRSKDKGVFELSAESPGTYALATIVAPKFLPYAPELAHSSVRITVGSRQAVRGVTLFLFPAVDYHGTVVDAQGAPVFGAKVKLADPSGEQTLEKLANEWITDAKGKFVFHAADFAVFEASKGGKRGWAILDGSVMTTHKMTITIGDAAARDATIRGKTVDATNQPLVGVRVTAVPEDPKGKQPVPRAVAFATSDAEGNFVLSDLDRDQYYLVAELDDHARAVRAHVVGGTQNVVIAMEQGLRLAGVVRDPEDKPVPSFTLLVTKREGLVREVITTRSVIDPRGRFDVRVTKGDYELLVSASGWAPGAPYPISAGTIDAKIKLTAGATLSGVVVDAQTGAPIPWARVTREGAGGGASAQPANAGTVTRPDGTFELAGIPAGPFTISIGAGGRHPRFESGLVATEGGKLGPIRVPLTKLAEGETPKFELVGIGVKLSADGEALRIDGMSPDGGAAVAGILVGDHIVAVDGVPVTTLGMDGSVARIRGAPHTKLSVTIEREGKTTTLLVERKPLRF